MKIVALNQLSDPAFASGMSRARYEPRLRKRRSIQR
jgi:hypothetical protein